MGVGEPAEDAKSGPKAPLVSEMTRRYKVRPPARAARAVPQIHGMSCASPASPGARRALRGRRALPVLLHGRRLAAAEEGRVRARPRLSLHKPWPRRGRGPPRQGLSLAAGVTGRSARRLASRRQSYSWLDWLCVVLPMMRWVRTYKLRQYLLVRNPASRHARARRPSCTLFALGRLRSLGNLACHAELVQTARCLVSRAAVHCADTHAEPAGGVALSLPAEPALQQPEARWLAHLPHGARRSALQLLMLQPRHQAWPIALRSWHCEAGAL